MLVVFGVGIKNLVIERFSDLKSYDVKSRNGSILNLAGHACALRIGAYELYDVIHGRARLEDRGDA